MLCDFAASADDDSEEGSEKDGRYMPCYTIDDWTASADRDEGTVTKNSWTHEI
jgi:hypothetical protein